MQKVEDKIKRETKSSEIHYRNALEITKRIRDKYKCGLSELPTYKLEENEKKIVYNAWIELGYCEEAACLIVFGNTYQFNLF